MLRTEDLWVEKTVADGSLPLLRGINLEVPSGQVTVLLGESGAGKTLLARAMSGLLPEGLRISRGGVFYRGRSLPAPGSWDGIRGRGIFYAPQNAAACFNPVLTIGRQIRECSRSDDAELEELLARLQFSDPRRVLRSHAFALSGGENQRCLLALALACGADVLILDEPTSEIDDDARDEFVRVLLAYQRARSLTVLLISHHLGFIRSIAQNLSVMSRGEVVARGPQRTVLASPVHAYIREIAAYLAAT
ncbi:MAG TPA: ATP-binding cassette domain-containing protein [Acidobacteriota bacterium]